MPLRSLARRPLGIEAPEYSKEHYVSLFTYLGGSVRARHDPQLQHADAVSLGKVDIVEC